MDAVNLLTIGTWDTPHMGHAVFLRKCERFADQVIVGVNTDEFVRSYKGAAPAFTYSERCALIRSLGYVTMPNDGPGRALVDDIGPDILAIGSDWARKDYHAQINCPQSWLDTRGISLVYISYTPGISTTILRSRLST